MPTLHKYPRTHHLEGSRLQPGDEDSRSVPFADLAGRHLVVEEKLDGANAGMSFDAAGRLWLQSRGHFLTGGAREKHFALFKRWAAIDIFHVPYKSTPPAINDLIAGRVSSNWSPRRCRVQSLPSRPADTTSPFTAS